MKVWPMFYLTSLGRREEVNDSPLPEAEEAFQYIYIYFLWTLSYHLFFIYNKGAEHFYLNEKRVEFEDV